MRGWLERMNWNMQRWMQGRYGQDELGGFLSLLSLILILLSSVSPVFTAIAFACLFFSMFRCYSKNLEKRRRERAAWLKIVGKPRNWFALQKNKWKDRKTHRYFKCGNCGQILRVPKGKGKIVISCPKCHKEHTRKT